MSILAELFADLIVENPKLSNGAGIGRENWFPYYAGFSTHFARSILESAGVPRGGCIVDPWNGSGTTTSAASSLGYQSIGFDLNPVMVLVAKARTLNKAAREGVGVVREEILRKTRRSSTPLVSEDDPLLAWFVPSSVASLRRLEGSLKTLLFDVPQHQGLLDSQNLADVSGLAAFFYTALFRTVRTLLKRFFASNPTWIKRPKDIATRIRPSLETILNTFDGEVSEMLAVVDEILFGSGEREAETSITVASSDLLPVDDESVDVVLTSPPYCTRIDYAVATLAELAVLGYDFEGRLRDLRRKLIGTATVPKLASKPSEEWGDTCNRFLENMAAHPSKASGSYYLKNHVQYFDAIHRSLVEINRVLKPRGGCVLVVQDSYYKDVHNDLPQMFIEMATSMGLVLALRQNFRLRRTMAGINPSSREYRVDFGATESVLCLRKSSNDSQVQGKKRSLARTALISEN